MSHFGHRCYPEDDEAPYVVEILQTAGPQPWHDEARAMRAEGATIRGIAAELGVGFNAVQRLLNPESRAKLKARQVERDRERRRSDPEYAEKVRVYNRRYAQFVAPGRKKP